MQASLPIAATGLHHVGSRQRATAHGTANLATPETTVIRALGREHPTGHGVETYVEGHTEGRQHLGAIGTAGPSASAPAVDHMVDQIATVHQAGALADVVRTTDDMFGSLLDILG